MLQSKRFQSHVPTLQNHGRNHHLFSHGCKYCAPDSPLQKALRYQ